MKHLLRCVLLVPAMLVMTPVWAEDAPLFSLKTPIERIAANPEARAVLERELPGFTAHPQYPQFKAMSLEMLLALAPNVLPAERVRAVDAALRAIPAPVTPPAVAAPPSADARPQAQ